MSHRPFSNNKIISYNDYNKQKIYNCKQIYKNNYINSSSKLLNLKKKCINNCVSLYPCIKSPITILQGKMSYICNNTSEQRESCNIIKQILYPYGYYLCKNNRCNTCVNLAAINNVIETDDLNTENNDLNYLNSYIGCNDTNNKKINYNLLDIFV